MLVAEERRQRAREQTIRMARQLQSYLVTGTLSGAKRLRVDLVFNFDFTRGDERASRRARQSTGEEADSNEYWQVERVLAVRQRRGATGYLRWFATIRWQGHERFGYADDEVPVWGVDEWGATLNAATRAEAAAMIRRQQQAAGLEGAAHAGSSEGVRGTGQWEGRLRRGRAREVIGEGAEDSEPDRSRARCGRVREEPSA